MGRYMVGSEPMVHLATRVSRETRDALQARAAELGTNPCALMRAVLCAALALDDQGDDEAERDGGGDGQT